jgi:hypothetical protein
VDAIRALIRVGCRPLLILVFVVLAGRADGQEARGTANSPRATVRATRVSRPPLIDGQLTDAGWSAAEPATSFRQRDPDEGRPVSERTEIRVLYDSDALYVGAWLFDREPGSVSRRLSNRDDEADADQFAVLLDPRHDHLTGVIFVVSAAGVQRDVAISNDTNEDGSWDAVWHSAVAADAGGWTAELRIPFSQLRFSTAGAQVWGINAARFIRRRNELAWLELVPKNENGQASRMGHLTGLEGIRSPRHLEVVPYMAARSEHIAPGRPGDPFNDGSRMFATTGLDVKSGVAGGLTLDMTINPDFGQAEVDPAVVNLSAYETFYEEKRRFFIEGAEIFGNFGQSGANNFFGFNTADPQIFYSRRIGRAPQGRADAEYADTPHATTILGAAKLTGKTAGGWSIGLVNAITDREHVRLMNGATPGRAQVEPLTNYFAARVKRDFSRGGVGVLATSVVRRLDTPALADLLTRTAHVVGGDGFFFIDRDRDWVVTGKLSGSRVTGAEAAMADLQRAPQRYYQRPDAPHVSFDPTRTSLSGFAGRINLNRNSGVWRVNAALWGVSPGFDSNDLGFHGGGDRTGGHAVLLWRKSSPDRFTRERQGWIAKAWTWNFNRQKLSDMWFACGHATLLNYWGVNGCAGFFRRTLDDQLTRGGPVTLSPQGRSVNVGFGSDGRKAVSFDANAGSDAAEFGGSGRNLGISITLKPSTSLTISTGPHLNWSTGPAQYVRTEADRAAGATFGSRYVFAGIDQTQVTLTTRLNFILTRRASLQVFMQPLLATGDYEQFKELAAPGTFAFREYGAPGTSISYDAVGRRYFVDPDADGAGQAFSFDDPDFNFKSLRVNAVLRWEFRPGSTLYAVWTEQREDVTRPGQFHFRRDVSTLFGAPGNDVFLVKVAYWLGK